MSYMPPPIDPWKDPFWLAQVRGTLPIHKSEDAANVRIHALIGGLILAAFVVTVLYGIAQAVL